MRREAIRWPDKHALKCVLSWCIVLGCTQYILLYLDWQFWTRNWTKLAKICCLDTLNAHSHLHPVLDWPEAWHLSDNIDWACCQHKVYCTQVSCAQKDRFVCLSAAIATSLLMHLAVIATSLLMPLAVITSLKHDTWLSLLAWMLIYRPFINIRLLVKTTNNFATFMKPKLSLLFTFCLVW